MSTWSKPPTITPSKSSNASATIRPTASAQPKPVQAPAQIPRDAVERFRSAVEKRNASSRPVVQPRGLINFRNTCFMNSILQSLIACDDFAHLMLDLAQQTNSVPSLHAPIVAEFVDFARQFCSLTLPRNVNTMASLVKPDNQTLPSSSSATTITDSKPTTEVVKSESSSSLQPSSSSTSTSTSVSISTSLHASNSVSTASPASTSETASTSSSAEVKSAINGADEKSEQASGMSKSQKRRAKKARSDGKNQGTKQGKSVESKTSAPAAAAETKRSEPSAAVAFVSEASSNTIIASNHSSATNNASTSSQPSATVAQVSSSTTNETAEEETDESESSSEQKQFGSKSARRRHRKRQQQQQPTTSASSTVKSQSPAASPASARSRSPATHASISAHLNGSNSSSTPASASTSASSSIAPTSRNLNLQVNSIALRPSLDIVLSRFQKLAMGRQEDAQEFLNYVLSELHDEMLRLGGGKPFDFSDSSSQLLDEVKAKQLADEEEDAGSWTEVGKGNRKRLIQSELDFTVTPISRIFGGRLRNVLSKHHSNLQDTISFQPFYTLPLEISSSSVRSLEDAIQLSMSSATVEGYKKSPGSRQEIRASHQTTLETLPTVLICHLKRFGFELGQGNSTKLMKEITYPSQLELNPKYLFGQALLSPRLRQYSLRAVVVHHGPRAAGGHYTCYVRYGASSSNAASSSSSSADSDEKDRKSKNSSSSEEEGWFHFDDQTVMRVSSRVVYKQSAYLLFYVRSAVQ